MEKAKKFKKGDKLQFNKDGTFKVLMMSDLQESANYDERSLRSVEILLDECQPDLVILGGDNCFGPKIQCEKDLKDFLEIFIAPMEKRNIPWAHVFGNHDHDAKVPIARQQEIYESFRTCVSLHTDESVSGKSNFALPVYDTKGELALVVWGLDTNHSVNELDAATGGNASKIKKHPKGFGPYGIIYFDQLLWYYNQSLDFEKRAGKKVAGLMCMHVAPYEFNIACENPQAFVREGSFNEPLEGAPFNSGLFALLLQRGDVKAVCAGHTHLNDFDAEYCGIRLLWDACVGYGCYGNDALRGGRLFTYHEDNPFVVDTKMVRTFDKIKGTKKYIP